ncbi:MAG TPA: hypothetical protein VKU41_23895 [Polyangiaceae bacterium]|nr:hypothetical protein [Polyangiaceae bacterium]
MTTISEVDLEPGDVLLSLGVGKLSEAIRQLDGGQYSHAALWTGSEILEATLPEVTSHPMADSLKEHPRVYIDAYRHRAAAGKTDAVVRQARRLLGQPYAKGDLLLLTALVATASWMPGARRQHGWLMVANGLDLLLSGGDSGIPFRDHAICTGLVVQSYAAAKVPIHVRQVQPGRFESAAMLAAVRELLVESLPRVRIPWFSASSVKKGASLGKGLGVEPGAPVAWGDAQATLRRRFEELTGQTLPVIPRAPSGRALKKDASPLFEAGDSLPHFVTPHYLEESPDLVPLGRLHGAAAAGTTKRLAVPKSVAKSAGARVSKARRPSSTR